MHTHYLHRQPSDPTLLGLLFYYGVLMKEIHEKPELSTLLSVDEDGNLLGLTDFQAKIGQSAKSKNLFALTLKASLFFTVFSGLGIWLLFYLGKAGLVNAAVTGAALLFFIFVMPIFFLVYVWRKILADPAEG